MDVEKVRLKSRRFLREHWVQTDFCLVTEVVLLSVLQVVNLEELPESLLE